MNTLLAKGAVGTAGVQLLVWLSGAGIVLRDSVSGNRC